MKHAGTGQYVWDLPVSSLISVKGGKGIWGMPKHQANLDFQVDAHSMSSQYDLDGKLCMRITVDRPHGPKIPLNNFGAVNWCSVPGNADEVVDLLHRSRPRSRSGRSQRPSCSSVIIPGWIPCERSTCRARRCSPPAFPHSKGVLDDHFESWFITSPKARRSRRTVGWRRARFASSASRTAPSGSIRPPPPGVVPRCTGRRHDDRVSLVAPGFGARSTRAGRAPQGGDRASVPRRPSPDWPDRGTPAGAVHPRAPGGPIRHRSCSGSSACSWPCPGGLLVDGARLARTHRADE